MREPIIIFLLCSIVFFSCKDENYGIDSIGSTLWLNHQSDTLIIRVNDQIEKVGLSHIGERINNPKWSKSSETFFLEVKNSDGEKNILNVTLKGEVVDSVLKSRTRFDFYFPSNGDSLFLIGRFLKELKITEYYIYNFDRKHFVDTVRIENTWFPQFQLVESPWGLSNKKLIAIKSSDSESPEDSIFTYDVGTKRFEFLFKGIHPSWSPVQPDVIAYHTQDEIHTFNITISKDSILFKAPWREKLSRLMWTPNGGLYFTLTGDRLLLKPFGGILSDKFYDLQIDPTGRLKRTSHSVQLIDSWK